MWGRGTYFSETAVYSASGKNLENILYLFFNIIQLILIFNDLLGYGHPK